MEAHQPAAQGPGRTPRGMVYIPGGEAELGSPLEFDENAVRTVVIEPFFIDVHPATNAQYAEFVAASGHRAPKHWVHGAPLPGMEDHPVVWLSWHDAAAYATWAGKRLPTEEEWEYAARGADGREYPWGSGFSPERCNCRHSDIGTTTPVGSFPGGASPCGCQDMAGNVWEWVDSWYDAARKQRVLRGGSWGNGPLSVRTVYRGRDLPEYWSNAYGVRCALSAQVPPPRP